MILQFVIAALLLLVIFSVVIAIHFTRDKSNQSTTQERRNQLNHELYDIRVKEVEDDIQQGVVIDKDTMIAELQYNLLDDIDDTVSSKQSQQNNSQRIWIPGVVFLILASLSLYWSVGAFKEMNDWQGALQRYPEIHKKLFEDNDSTPNEKELEDLMLGLRTHLENEPNDAQGWVLYSRLGRVFKDKELALDAIKKAIQAAPNNAEIELEYIELKMKLGDEYSQATAESMLNRFLQKYPDNYEGWSMYGFMALQQENFVGAIERWQKMLALVDQSSEKASMLKNSIAYAQEQLALQKQPEQVEQKTVSAEQSGVEQNNDAPAIIGAAYEVNVSLSEQVNYAKNSTLFVYAQSVNGSPMPIAAIKLPISTFPVKVVLSDANAMMQGIKLSDHPQFIIKARISADGTVNKDVGQWSGESGVINAGEENLINIKIDQQS
ncbi:c-type cytochrome biogenesis protein CcmI [Psychromonas sp. SP041]|uniref:c-type cytochrome biogenesis protein CcmI n=1 Tax=Psychromonas sp. SP041 TaxID=1365007 RepID=UPI0004083295|nr:c-type cytochrome biogenesis protein CcmI [Psychromonas sp. SP041]